MGDSASSSSCPDEDAILGFATGSLDATVRARVLAHVDTCASCRSLAAELARTSDPPPGHTGDQDADDEEPTRSRPGREMIDDRYRLGSPLGRGAMGTVYRAHDEKLGTDVAVKIIHASSADAARTLARELTVGRRVTHPNVCRFHDSGESDGLAYITMELVEGQTLAHMLAAGELPIPEAVRILDGIAAGLAAAHEKGIVHRDLKPANVMIERETGRPVLTDFGFATDLEAKQSRRLVGTPAYWAPEQARGERTTPASDVYSFGLIAYRLLARTEFTINDDEAIDAVPRPHRAFVRKCTEPRPSDRFRTAAEARTALSTTKGHRGQRTRVVLGLVALNVVAGVVVAVRPESSHPSTSTVGPDPRSSAPAAILSIVGSASASPTLSAPLAAQTDAPAGADTNRTPPTATSPRFVHPPSRTSLVPSTAVAAPSASSSSTPSAAPSSSSDILIRR